MWGNITNNRTNTPVVVSNSTAERNNIIREIKAVLSELHSKTILLSAMSTVDHHGNISNTNAIKCIHQKIQDQINHVKSSTTVNTLPGVSKHSSKHFLPMWLELAI